MKLEFTCIKVSDPHHTGQSARLRMKEFPPEPAADGHGNPVSHPRHPGGTLELFVTTEERRALLRQLGATERKLKKRRHEASIGIPEAKDDAVKLEHERDATLKELNALKEFRFEHGARYTITVEKVK